MTIDSLPYLAGIYLITCLANDRTYVGSSKNIHKRLVVHRRQLQQRKHRNYRLQQTWDEYGESQFAVTVLELCVESRLLEREAHWFNQYGVGDIARSLNIAIDPASGSRGVKHSLETKAKISQSRKRKCAWNGIEYQSIGDAANAMGISRTTMNRRINSGHICDDDVVPLKKLCVWEGVEYSSVASAARAAGIKAVTMQQRMAKGHQSLAYMPLHNIVCVWDGVEYESVSEAARANNVSLSTMHQRIKHGHTSKSDLRPNKRTSR